MTSLPEKLAETFRSAGVKSAYGDPVQIDGVTLIPVALSYYGFGGGDAGEGGAVGSGGGGGGVSLPIGAYVKSGGTARFEPNVIALLAVGVPFLLVAGRALARIIRALKK
ncbi:MULTISPECIES: hypothetical protein [Cryobacterium]|jgi:uncharacterized spore protein YtfJ|uniref:Sporulation protein n=1 Tax=Cryobacterium lyxosi TaxID=1259228 RepID=A0A4R8ZIT1_9MICO|nr:MULTISPECIES: hypothetical protein [Cryobacterium]TFD28529.1 hypothetical protein E3T27_01020 [Cryobacterium lyxosi]